MDEQQRGPADATPPSEPVAGDAERLEWEKPILLVQDVAAVTQGGILTNPHADGNQYS